MLAIFASLIRRIASGYGMPIRQKASLNPRKPGMDLAGKNQVDGSGRPDGLTFRHGSAPESNKRDKLVNRLLTPFAEVQRTCSTRQSQWRRRLALDEKRATDSGSIENRQDESEFKITFDICQAKTNHDIARRQQKRSR